MKNLPKILIVEDDPDQILMYTVEFESYNFQVVISRKGSESAQLATKEQPDVILLDILMEDKSGLDVLRELKGTEETKHIPVIVFTNFSKEKFEQEAKELGAAKFITKTSRVPREIVADVRELIGLNLEEEKMEKARRSENILMIEDNPYHRQMYMTKFSHAGFSLITAVNGEEGLRQVHEGGIDVILLDLALPGMSGVDVLKKLQGDPATKDIPVIAFTVTPKEELPSDTRKYLVVKE